MSLVTDCFIYMVLNKTQYWGGKKKMAPKNKVSTWQLWLDRLSYNSVPVTVGVFSVFNIDASGEWRFSGRETLAWLQLVETPPG